MRRSVLAVLVFQVIAVAWCARADAQGVYRMRVQFTNPGNITVLVTGALAGTPDPAGEFSVVVEDAFTGQPVSGVPVTLTLTGGAGIQFYPGRLNWTVGLLGKRECQTQTTVTASTVDGIAYFRPCGTAVHLGACGDFGSGGLLSAPGVANPVSCQVACYDHDGNGVNINDLSLFLADLGCSSYVGHADYDGSQSVGVNDLSALLAIIGAGNSSERPSMPSNCVLFP